MPDIPVVERGCGDVPDMTPDWLDVPLGGIVAPLGCGLMFTLVEDELEPGAVCNWPGAPPTPMLMSVWDDELVPDKPVLPPIVAPAGCALMLTSVEDELRTPELGMPALLEPTLEVPSESLTAVGVSTLLLPVTPVLPL